MRQRLFVFIFAGFVLFLSACGGGGGDPGPVAEQEQPEVPLYSLSDGEKLGAQFAGHFVLVAIRTVTEEGEVLDLLDVAGDQTINIDVSDTEGYQRFDAVNLLFGFGPFEVSGNISLFLDPQTLIIEITASNLGALPVGELYNMKFEESGAGFGAAIEGMIGGEKVYQYYDFEKVE